MTGGLSNVFRFVQGFIPDKVQINWVYLAVNVWLVYEQLFFVLYTWMLLYLADVNYKNRPSSRSNWMKDSIYLMSEVSDDSTMLSSKIGINNSAMSQNSSPEYDEFDDIDDIDQVYNPER